MPIDNVLDNPRRVQYVAAAAQEDFDYGFAIFAEADLVVEVDGVVKTISTDYTVSGVGEDAGGTVSFVVAMVGDEIVTIHSDTEIARTTDIQQNGPIASSVLNNEIDRLFVIAQELKSKIARAIRFPFSATQDDADSELSPIANWYGKFLRVSSAGILEAAEVVSSVVALTQSVIGELLYPQTPAESAALVTPVSFQYVSDTTPYNDMRRYGLPTDGTSDCTAALNSAIAVNAQSPLTIRFKFPRGVFNFLSKPNNISLPMWIEGDGRNVTYLVRDYTEATVSNGILNFRDNSTGSTVKDLLMGTASARTGGCLLSVVAPAGADSPDWMTLEHLRLTNSQGLGGTGNGPDYCLYMDGSARTGAALGIRDTWLDGCAIFGGALGSAFLKCVNGLHGVACDFLSAGSVSGQVSFKGISGNNNNNGVFLGCTFADIDLDYITKLLIESQLDLGTITQVAANITGLRILAPQSEFVHEKLGGNLFTGRYNSSNPRGGVYVAGTAGAPLLGGNLDWSSGNTFNFDKTGIAWYVGDPTGSGHVLLGASTGTAGNSAGVHDDSAVVARMVPGVAFGVKSYTVAGLPSAAVAGLMIFVSNEAGGAVLAFSDGTNWRRVTDRAIVS